MQKERSGPHKRAWRVYTSQLPRVLGLLAFQVLLRLVAFAPLIYAALSGSFPGFADEHALAFGLVFSLPLYALLVMPFRFQAGAAKANLHGIQQESGITPANYLKWLPAALVRLLRALPFILPFLAFIALYYYYISYPDFTVPMLAISDLGDVIGLGFLGGVIIIGLAGLIVALLAAFGWKRDIAFEHQDILRLGIAQSLSRARALRQRRKRTINKTVMVNLLLCLPAIIGVLAVLASHLMGQRVGVLYLDYLNIASKLLKLDIPSSTLLGILLVLVVLWLPLLPWRKLALSAVVAEPVRQA